jgi:hypothetical protein
LKRLLHIMFSFFFLAYLWNCAKVGNIDGGPRDTTPPVVVKSNPLNRSLNFSGNQIEITFDEYIKPASISEKLVISPPFKEMIVTRMRGKTLIIEMEDTLKESTTYTLSFGDAIEDLNEGNVLPNYEFVFSTGNYMDSLAVTGTVLQAIDLEPVEEQLHISLYSNLNDSAPYLEVPEYVGKATEEGAFLINNIHPGKYRLFALQDQNRNLKYDVPGEQIGFLDTLIVLSADMFEFLEPESPVESLTESVLADSVLADTSLLIPDDSLSLHDLARYSVMVDVFTFIEDNEPQYMIDNKREDRRSITLLFNREVLDTISLEPLNFTPPEKWFLIEKHVMKDTFKYWITDSLIYKRDSLKIIAHYQASDTMMNLVPFDDTLNFNFREPVQSSSRRRNRPDTIVVEKIDLELNIMRAGKMDVYKDISITANHPVMKIDTSRISFTYREDTIDVPVDYSLDMDEKNIRSSKLVTEWKEGYFYDLNIFPGAVEDIYGLTHDTTIVNFQARHKDSYGTIQLNLSGLKVPAIVQVIDKNSNVIRSLITNSDGALEFQYLEPATYKLKLIRDYNGNGKWDTGIYLDGLQPDMVTFNKESIALRANFHYEVNWDLSQ